MPCPAINELVIIGGVNTCVNYTLVYKLRGLQKWKRMRVHRVSHLNKLVTVINGTQVETRQELPLCSHMLNFTEVIIFYEQQLIYLPLSLRVSRRWFFSTLAYLMRPSLLVYTSVLFPCVH